MAEINRRTGRSAAVAADIREAGNVPADIRQKLDNLRDITGRDVILYASDNPSMPEGFTRGGRDYAKDNGVYTVFHAAHENAHNMPQVLNAIAALMDDDVITEADFRQYMRARVRNITARRGGRSGMLSEQQSRTEFSCDLFGAVMYAELADDNTIYELIGVSGDLIQKVENAVHNALAYDPEVEHDLDASLADNDAACGNEDAVEFSDVDIKNALGGTLTDENVEFIQSIYDWDGQDHRGFFRVGMPSDALLSIGVPNVPIHLDQSKAVKIVEKHPEMGNLIFWAIPEAINDPTIIVESTDNSFIVFGEASFNGHPVSIVMRMKSTQRGTANIETCKVRSSYVMNDKDIVDVLGDDNENVVYLNENKNRTDAWFQAGGQPLRAPVGGSKFGSIRRLSYADSESNTQSDFSENPLTESPEIRAAMDKARTLFENGVHYLAYYNQEGADNGVAKFLRGLWDSANKTDVLNRALKPHNPCVQAIHYAIWKILYGKANGSETRFCHGVCAGC